MYLDIDGRGEDDHLIDSAISWRDGLLLALVAHLLLAGLIIFAPRFLPAPAQPTQVVAQRQEPPLKFVFIQPRLDLTTKTPKPDAPASDKDRLAQSPERAQHPLNFEPRMRGNSPNQVMADRAARARGKGPNPEPQRAQPQPPKQLAENQQSWNVPIETPRSSAGRALPPDPAPAVAPPEVGRAATPGGLLGDALANLKQYVQKDQFDNPSGDTGKYGPAFQFDSKGVDFGPWLQRFIAQIRRNWFIPYAVMGMKGHVVLTFNVHKDGRITDLQVAGPSDVSAFNNAAFNALVTSNPTQPLPAAYPSEHAFFTVTFYYNETPGR
ncbi:MAG: energy transducer TonB [Acidobacteriota bacterium]|nr:energy transducer TonB [Acidobacteriota bacterium]